MYKKSSTFTYTLRTHKATGFKVETMDLDLSSFASIRLAAANISEKHPQLDSLVLNAGIMVGPHLTMPTALIDRTDSYPH